MSRTAGDWAEGWVGENISADAYDPPQGVIDATIAKMVADAKENGFTKDQLETAVGDLDDFISNAMESATDSEVAYRAARDD